MSDFDFENSDNKDDLVLHARSIGLPVDQRYSIDRLKDLIRSEKKVLDSQPTEADQASQQMMRLMIHKTEGDTGSIDVPVSVNGKTWLIKRGHEVIVPRYVVDVLKNAVRDIYVPVDTRDATKGQERREVPAYPFTAMAA
jgi:hypothetical protein